MAKITIRIEGKIAQNPNDFIVCGNSDYQIQFSFTEEWKEHKIKTARFIYEDCFEDIVFDGDTVCVPVFKDITVLAVGVFAGNLQTTTPALINCRRSILCENGSPAEPTPDVYAQIMELLNNSGAGGGGGGGVNGATFTPNVSADGIISWTNDRGLKNPQPVDITGPQGPQGPQGEAGPRGEPGEKGNPGEKGDPYTLTEQDKNTIVDAVLANFIDVSEVAL